MQRAPVTYGRPDDAARIRHAHAELDRHGRAAPERLSWKACAAAALSILAGLLIILPDHAATGQSTRLTSFTVPADTDSVAAEMVPALDDVERAPRTRSEDPQVNGGGGDNDGGGGMQGLTGAISDTDSVAVSPDRPGAMAGVSPGTSDTDSVAIAPADSFPRVQRYLPKTRRGWAASPPAGSRTFSTGPDPSWDRDILFDDSTGQYVTRQRVNGFDVRYPLVQDVQSYRQMQLRQGISSNWQTIITQRRQERQRARRQGGFGVNIKVPGGRNSAFTTIFGKPQVDLRVNGQAQITAGFNRQQSDQQSAFLGGDGIQWDPQFNQNMNLGITGTIGDKLHVNVDWDTQSQFDYQNQLKLDYKGYEDDIVQSVEAGNVYLKTPSSLIQGGQKLFGIKSEFQFGPVHLTTVASQEKGQGKSLSLTGGATTTDFSLRPTEYEADRHFFLGYYFRNRWEDALSNPPRVQLAHQFSGIEKIEVWRLNVSTAPAQDEEVRTGIAVVDLGESEDILTEADAFTQQQLPNPNFDQYTEEVLNERLRSGEADNPSVYLTSQGLSNQDFQYGKFEKLSKQEYEFDNRLGYVTLTTPLRPKEALAVAYTYNAGGQTYQVGDFAESSVGEGDINEDALVLKLLRPGHPRVPSEEIRPAAWFLQMRNIYNIPASGVEASRLELQIDYAPPGSTPTPTLPEVGGQRKLLELLGLDRLNVNDSPRPDDQIDPLPGFTIEPSNGLLIFPYLQPFGNRIADVVSESGAPNASELVDRYAFSRLYVEKPEIAVQDQVHNVYRISGTVKGRQSSFYDLGAFSGLVEGSVNISADGQQLVEGSDYVVDYTGGTVRILNKAYTAANTNLNISYEQNSLFSFQQKTLLGARADLSWSEDFTLGATLMHLSEKTQVDKYRVGEEPISNLIWGFDGALQMESRWLTRMLDALPLVQTRIPSHIEFSGEVARLQPGRTLTSAFEHTRREIQQEGEDFSSDELQGVSYLDSFEGFENTLSLDGAGGWRLAAPPDSIGVVDAGVTNGDEFDALARRSYWRGKMGWFKINPNQVNDLLEEAPQYTYPGGGVPVGLVSVKEIFPGRDLSGLSRQERTITTFDMYYNPQSRGQYNYTKDLETFINNPTDTWGGITLTTPPGYNDFAVKNIEFVEFIVRPFAENQSNDAGEEAMLYLNLGSISEDVLPDGERNTEDGLLLSEIRAQDTTRWGRLPSGSTSQTLDFEEESGRTEDLGYDGLASEISYAGDPNRYLGTNGELLTEQTVFSDFMSALPEASASNELLRAEVARAQYDPSNDDYHHYRESEYFNNDEYFPSRPGVPGSGATFQERFVHFYGGQELNGFSSQDNIAQNSVRQGVARYPDDEDLNETAAIDTDNSYFEYGIPLGRDELQERAVGDDPGDFVVGEIQNNGQGTGWYLVRIPIHQWDRRVGQIQDFSTIENIRLWTTGHKVPITMRFASMELVGSRWRKSDAIVAESRDSVANEPTNTRLSIASINSEEDAGRYVQPDAVVQRQSFGVAGGARQTLREQAMVVRAENLVPGQRRGVYKNFSDGLDLLKYSNLRMFTHLHGELENGMSLYEVMNNASISEGDIRKKVKLFVRLGSSETGDYYQYTQPLTPSPASAEEVAGDGEPDDLLWRTNQTRNGTLTDLNSMNIELGALNQLKVERDRRGVALDSTFHHTQVSGLIEEVARFAPPGTRLSIKGNPSLGRITTIVVGLMAARDDELVSQQLRGTLRSAEIWINELRVSGYDQKPGWASEASTNIQLADLGYIRGNFANRTSGFGGLSSTLGSREQRDKYNWALDARLNIDQLLPERFGWTIPLQVRYSSNNSTPIFAPSRGDVRVDDLIELVEQDESIEEEEQRNALMEEIRQAALTADANRTMQVSISKNNSQSALLRNTLDNLRFSVNYSDRQAHNPSNRKNNSWQWGSHLEYQFDGNPYAIQPLSFLSEIPLLGFLGALSWNLVPNAIDLSGTANRSFARSQNRLQVLRNEQPLPYDFAAPVNDRHSFAHTRNIDFQYNPFNFLGISYQSNTDQSMHRTGVDTISSIAIQDADGDLLQTYRNMTIREAYSQSLIDSVAIRQGRVTQVDSLHVLPLTQTVRNAFSLQNGLRTDNYGQQFNVRLHPELSDIKALDWVQLNDISYNAQYDWKNGPPDRLLGSRLNNRSSINTGITIEPQALWQKFGFYRDWEAASEKESAPDSNATLLSTLPSPLEILREGFLIFTRINAISVSYQNQWQTATSAVGQGVFENGRLVDVNQGYSLFGALAGSAPPLGYRLGFDRRLGPEFRVFGDAEVTDHLTNNHSLSANTALQPIKGLNIQLNWTANWQDNQNITYGRQVSLDDSLTANVHTGQNQVSIWSFGTSYVDLVETQLEALESDVNSGNPESGVIGDENGDGRIALSNPTLMRDFQRAFTRGPGAFGPDGTMPFPMPSWTITYSGASQWPLLKSIANGITIRHGYFSSYSTGYRFDQLGASAGAGVDLGGFSLDALGSDLLTETININESFNPLVEVSVRWKGGIQTSLGWNASNSYGINQSRQIRESVTNELSLTAGWQKQGFQFPFLSFLGQLDNTIRFNMTASISSNLIRSFQIRNALQEAALADLQYDPEQALTGENNVTEATNTTRYSLSPQISYRFSNRVSGTMFLKYNNLQSANGLTPSMNTLNGGFTVNVSIANN